MIWPLTLRGDGPHILLLPLVFSLTLQIASYWENLKFWVGKILSVPVCF